MRRCLLVAWLVACALGAPLALAQDDGAGETTGGEAEDIGGARLKGSLRSVAYFSDNYYNESDGGTSGYGTLINPELSFLKQSSKVELGGAADAEYGLFNLPGSQDDYLDGGALLRLTARPTLRNQVRLDGSFRHGHDAFGVNRTEDATARDDELDRWNRTTGALHYRYGAPGARLNAEVGVGGLEKHYVTNRVATEPLNYESTTVDYALFYNFSAKTSVLFDFSRSDFSFDRNFGVADTRGGELYRARTGLKWLATGKTSGDVRAGYRRRTFDAGTADLEGVDWEAGVDWAPVPRATLRLETARSEQESYIAGVRVIDIRSTRFDAKYNVTSRARATLVLEQLTADFDQSGREDDIFGVDVGGQYLASSFLWVVGSLGTTSRDSTAPNRDYDRINAFLGLRLGRP